MSAEPDEAREFAKAYREFLSWVHAEENQGAASQVVSLVRDHLPSEALTLPVVTRDLATFEQVNLQVAIDAWMVEDERSVEVHGLTVPPHYGPVGLQQLIHGDALPPVWLSAPDLVDLPSGPGRTLACLQRALLLVQDRRGSYVVLLKGPDRRHDQTLSLEIAGLATEDAQEVLGELDELRSRLNIYRGQLLELVANEMGVSIVFPVLPATERADVVLPEAVLRRIERHTLDVSQHRAALLAAGQHLKRGLLLYGPPGAGKTHTTRYIVKQMVGTTVILLSGQSLHFIGMVSTLARELQPAAVVLEDVDLVAEDRGYGPGPSPVLFTLLDAMDGAAADADLLFLLTTNRADLLEPALAARPGRVDVAIEIELPDADARRRLFAVYSRTLPLVLTEAEIDEVVERTDGVTASFVKELLRRAALEALTEGDGSLDQVTGAHVSRALDDLLESGQAVTRVLLGVQEGSEIQPPRPGRTSAGHGGVEWLPGAAAYRSSFSYRFDNP
jgi:cell division protease FtsH